MKYSIGVHGTVVVVNRAGRDNLGRPTRASIIRHGERCKSVRIGRSWRWVYQITGVQGEQLILKVASQIVHERNHTGEEYLTVGQNKREVRRLQGLPQKLQRHFPYLLDWDLNHHWLIVRHEEFSERVRDTKGRHEEAQAIYRAAFGRARDIKENHNYGVRPDGSIFLFDLGF